MQQKYSVYITLNLSYSSYIEQYMHCTVFSLIFFLLQQKVCHHYWPKFQGEAGTYGDFTVTQQTFDAYGDYVVRKLSVAMEASDEPPL